MASILLKAKWVDIKEERVVPINLSVVEGVIQGIEEINIREFLLEELPFLMPGFIDAHVHIESSMLVPAQFARMAVVHGTVATVSDPHEIANVCGMEGVDFMIENGKMVPFKFFFGAPSCVPATAFETAGATLDVADVEALLARPEIHYLSEMMNFPGVINQIPEVLSKLEVAKKFGKPIDGHAPGLMGKDVQSYIDAGISTDHECFTYEEALGKLKRGMKIIIREGSAAKNFEALAPLLDDWCEQIMFCSDDKHPDSLLLGHINQLCARAVKKGIDVFKVLRAACINPVAHYSLGVGQLQVGDPADFILVKDLENFEVLQTYIDGILVAEEGFPLLPNLSEGNGNPINRFRSEPVAPVDFIYSQDGLNREIPVIEALDGQLITNRLNVVPKIERDCVVPDLSRDILKIAVVNRYVSAQPAIAFIRNFGLKRGALASSVAHDSHNIVVVGCDDYSVALAVNTIITDRGGICATDGIITKKIALPVAGLMTFEDGFTVSTAYAELDKYAKDELGAALGSPFMTLSFMALLVIPHLKLSDKGLFDGDTFCFIPT